MSVRVGVYIFMGMEKIQEKRRNSALVWEPVKNLSIMWGTPPTLGTTALAILQYFRDFSALRFCHCAYLVLRLVSCILCSHISCFTLAICVLFQCSLFCFLSVHYSVFSPACRPPCFLCVSSLVFHVSGSLFVVFRFL